MSNTENEARTLGSECALLWISESDGAHVRVECEHGDWDALVNLVGSDHGEDYELALAAFLEGFSEAVEKHNVCAIDPRRRASWSGTRRRTVSSSKS